MSFNCKVYQVLRVSNTEVLGTTSLTNMSINPYRSYLLLFIGLRYVLLLSNRVLLNFRILQHFPDLESYNLELPILVMFNPK